MSISRFSGNEFSGISAAKRYANGNWVDLTTAKRFDGQNWVDLLEKEPSGSFTKTYSMTESAVYWNNGSKDNQAVTDDSLIHGTWNSGISSTRRSLLWFDNALFDDVADAQIQSVELYLKRESSTHGNAGAANVRIKAHDFDTVPSKWTGSDSGSAASIAKLNRGVGEWFALSASFGAGLQNGSIFGIALDADSSVSMSDYCRFVRTGSNAPKLRITYTR